MKPGWRNLPLTFLILFSISYGWSVMAFPACGTSEKPGDQGQKPLIAVIPHDFPPTYFRDPKTGNPTGLAVDLTNEIARRAGIKLEYHFGEPWEEIEQELLTGKADLIPLRVIDDETLDRFIFTHQLDAAPVNYIVRDSTSAIRPPISGEKVGVIRGSAADVYFKKRPDIKVQLVAYNSMEHLFMDLITGRIDVALTVTKNLLELAGKAGLDDRVRVIEPPAFEVTRAIALRKNDAAMRDRLNRAIESLEGTPEENAIYRRWLEKAKSYWTVQRLVLVFGGCVILLVAAFVTYRFVVLRRLASERAFLQTMIDAIPQPVFYKNRESVYLGCNDFFARDFLGLPKDRIIGKTDLDLFGDGEMTEHFCLKDRETLEKGELTAADEWITLADGRAILVETIKVPFRDELGEIGGLIGIARDVTNRELEKTRQIEARKRLQVILDNLPAMAWLKDRHGRYEMVNEAFADVLQLSVADIIGKTDLELWPQHAEADRSEDDQVQTARRQMRFDLQIATASGMRWFTKYKAPISDEQGEVSGTTGVAVDITERLQAEQDLRESEKRFRDMFEKAPDAILLVDTFTQRIIMSNDRASTMLGYNQAEMRQLRVKNIHPDEALALVQEKLELLRQEEIVFAAGIPVRRKDGSVFFADISGFLIVLRGQTYILGAFRDVTARKQAEEDLLREKQLSDEIINCLPGTFYLFDERGKFLRWNANLERFSGYDHEEISRLDPVDFLGAVAEMLITREQGIEAPLLRKDGGQVPYYFTSRRIEHGGAPCVIGVGIDVSEQRRAEQVLVEQKWFLQLLLDSIPANIFYKNSAGVYQGCNQGFADYLGRPKEAIIGKTLFEVFPPDEAEQYLRKDQELFQHPGAQVYEATMTGADGESRNFIFNKATFVNLTGEVAGLIGTMTDITEHKKIEQALRESEERYRTLVDLSPDIIYRLDHEGRILFISQAVAQLGYEPEELVGRKLADIIFPLDLQQLPPNCVERRTGERALKNMEIRFMKKSGGLRDYSVQSLTYSLFSRGVWSVADDQMNAPGKEFLWTEGVAHDISGLKRAEMELWAARNAAEAASCMKSDFLASMSHELRTPLSAIVGLAEILQQQNLGALNAKHSKYVDNILFSGRQLLSVVNDLLDLAKIESGRMVLTLSPVKLDELVQQSLLMIKEKALKHSLRLEASLDPELADLELMADERKLKQIMFNLLSNAAKFTPDGGEIKIIATQDDDQLRISNSRNYFITDLRFRAA